MKKYDELNNKVIELEKKVETLEKGYKEEMKKWEAKLDQWVDKRIHELREIGRKIEAKLDDMNIKLE